MAKLCDLHTHSSFSDGTDSPAQLLAAAEAAGLSAVALTDHNTTSGLPDFLRAAEGSPVEAVCGAEFSVDWEGTELHLLGLFLPPASFATIETRMEPFHRAKEESNLNLVESLNRAGYALDYGAIRARSPGGTINRAHIAQELTDLGYTASVKEAFGRLLSPDGPHYREPKRPTVWEMMDFIRELGAVPVLAHPFLKQTEAQLRTFLPEAKRRGLVGMETAYSKYTPEIAALASEMAKAFGLLPSGGSDYHGTRKPDIALGRGRGDLAVPHAWLEALREAIPHHA